MVRIPFGGVSGPERFGRPVARAPVDWGALSEVGLMILKPDVGDFALRVREVGVYR